MDTQIFHVGTAAMIEADGRYLGKCTTNPKIKIKAVRGNGGTTSFHAVGATPKEGEIIDFLMIEGRPLDIHAYHVEFIYQNREWFENRRY